MKNTRHSSTRLALFITLLAVGLLTACEQGSRHNGSFRTVDEMHPGRQGIAEEIDPLKELETNTESYEKLAENEFFSPLHAPYSTFSIDVDAASYANARRFINQGELPPPDAIRIEEFVNYFHYDYPQPKGETPFEVYTELSECPWNPQRQLVHIGLQGREVAYEHLPPSNLVFLLDVSGSMGASNKLPLLKHSLRLLVEKLRPEDRVAIVVYAGAAGLVLPSTPGDEKMAILESLERLEAGGSTAGAAGIDLAYQTAQEHFVPGGNNRIILATDGDFNVGPNSDGDLERLIEQKRESGIFLTVLGFGMGNYKDDKMQTLADKGNGNHAYIDTPLEAQKVLVSEFGGTLFTIAKDVKLQVEFNPAAVKAYRLIGYENRMLRDQDFNDDKKDAGELGSGHTVTALYEIIPANSSEPAPSVDAPRYQMGDNTKGAAYASGEMLHVKVRYKAPDGDQSRLIDAVLADTPGQASDNFRWAAAVAEFAALLKGSQYAGQSSYDQVLDLAKASIGEDPEGYRAEFIGLVKRAKALDTRQPIVGND